MKRDIRLVALAIGLCGLAACKDKPGGGFAFPRLGSDSSSESTRENYDANEIAEARKLKAVKDPINEQIYAFRVEVRMKYNNSNFDELEKQATELRAGKETFGDGSWKLSQYYSSFACRDEEPESMWELHDRIHRGWIAAKPESITAKIAYADFLTEYAWQARGSGYADEVTLNGRRLFKERLEAASGVLKEAMKLPDKDPMLGRVFLTVALGQGWPKPAWDTMMQKLRKDEPTFWSYDLARAYSLLPRWHGEPGDWEAFAEEAASHPAGLGNEVYARVVMDLHGYYDNIFGETKASWSRTREGLEQLRKKYPDSLEFVNITAYLAAHARDRELANEMFDRLGDTYSRGIWEKPERFTHYRNWARTGNW